MFILKSLKSCVMRDKRLLGAMRVFGSFAVLIVRISGLHRIFAKAGYVYGVRRGSMKSVLLNALGSWGSLRSGVIRFSLCLKDFGTGLFLGVKSKPCDRQQSELQGESSGMEE